VVRQFGSWEAQGRRHRGNGCLLTQAPRPPRNVPSETEAEKSRVDRGTARWPPQHAKPLVCWEVADLACGLAPPAGPPTGWSPRQRQRRNKPARVSRQTRSLWGPVIPAWAPFARSTDRDHPTSPREPSRVQLLRDPAVRSAQRRGAWSPHFDDLADKPSAALRHARLGPLNGRGRHEPEVMVFTTVCWRIARLMAPRNRTSNWRLASLGVAGPRSCPRRTIKAPVFCATFRAWMNHRCSHAARRRAFFWPIPTTCAQDRPAPYR